MCAACPFVLQLSSQPLRRTARRVVRRWARVVRARAARACVLVCRDVPRQACARAGVARRAAKKEEGKCRPTKDKGQRFKASRAPRRVPRRDAGRAAAGARLRGTPKDRSSRAGDRSSPAGGSFLTRVRIDRSSRVGGSALTRRRMDPHAPEDRSSRAPHPVTCENTNRKAAPVLLATYVCTYL